MPNNYTQQERQVLLNALGNGRPNAIGARRLAQILGYPTDGNQVQLRALIKECIEVDGDLIGAATGNLLQGSLLFPHYMNWKLMWTVLKIEPVAIIQEGVH